MVRTILSEVDGRGERWMVDGGWCVAAADGRTLTLLLGVLYIEYDRI